jgi:steroid delta-isomerase-like uncharacterized protein
MSLHDPVALSRAYFDAWNRHDLDAVMATFAPGGTYRDPFTVQAIGGKPLKGFAAAMFGGLPDLSFAYGGPFPVSATVAHVPWVLEGHQTGPFNEMPPSGRAVRLEGIDVVEVGPGGITQVVGYYDSATFLRCLGLNLVPQPA